MKTFHIRKGLQKRFISQLSKEAILEARAVSTEGFIAAPSGSQPKGYFPFNQFDVTLWDRCLQEDDMEGVFRFRRERVRQQI